MARTVQCEICPRACVLKPGQAGNCRIRVNVDGELTLTTYGYPCAVHVDPVEKKPLFHFLPGSRAFSIATVGCNLHCKNCQNWEISQASPDEVPANQLPPKALVEMAKRYECESIAYTYTDPVVFYEYAYDTSVIAKENGVKNILVTAGYINEKPWRKLCKVVDAANIDLKGFSNEFYLDVCEATLKPVLDGLVHAKKAGVVVEVTNLLIPGLNDGDKTLNDLCKWVRGHMGVDTPLHFSRFTPRYKMRNLPATPVKTLRKAADIAKSHGLDFVYMGNVLEPGAENTYCPKCGTELVARKMFTISKNVIKNGACPKCGKEIYGLWS